MAIRDHDDFEWALEPGRRRARFPQGHAAEEDYAEPPRLGETLIELAITAAGFAAIVAAIWLTLRQLA